MNKNKKLLTFAEFAKSLSDEQLAFLIDKQWRPQTLCMLPNHSLLETLNRKKVKQTEDK